MVGELLSRVTSELGPIAWSVGAAEVDETVHAVGPTPHRPYYTLLATGTSPASTSARTVLTICLPASWFEPEPRRMLEEPFRAWPVTLLQRLVASTRREGARLAVLQSMALDLAPARRFAGVLIVEPVLVFPDLRSIGGVRLLAVVPLLRGELALAHELGDAELWRALRRAGVTELLQLDRVPCYFWGPADDGDGRLDERSRWAALAGVEPRAARTFAGFDLDQHVPRVRTTGEYTLVTAMPQRGELVGLPHARWLAARGAWQVLRELWADKCNDVSARAAVLAGSTPTEPRRPRTVDVLVAGFAGLGIAFDAGADEIVPRLLGPDEIRARSGGQPSGETLDDAPPHAPVPGGLLCPEIFGEGAARYVRTGHLELARPVIHPWFLRPVAMLLDLRVAELATWPIDAVCARLEQLDVAALDAGAGDSARIARELRASGVAPRQLVLRALPVAPAAVRPLVPLDDGRFAASDLNDLYRRVIDANRRGDPRELQAEVIGLMCNGEYGDVLTSEESGRVLRSLASLVEEHLRATPRRVDFSAAAVVEARPGRSPRECAIPAVIADRLLDERDTIVLVTPTVWRSAQQPIVACDIVRSGAGDAIGLAPELLAALGVTAGDCVSVHVPLGRAALAEANARLRFGAPDPAATIDGGTGWLSRARQEEVIDWTARGVLGAQPERAEELALRLLLGR